MKRLISVTVAVILVVGLGAALYVYLQYRENNNSGSIGTTNQQQIPSPEGGERIILVGESTDVGGVRITLHSIAADYRCGSPDCPEAGSIVVNATYAANGASVTQNFPSDEVPFEFNGYKISISNIAPSRPASGELEQSEYQVTFKVELIS